MKTANNTLPLLDIVLSKEGMYGVLLLDLLSFWFSAIFLSIIFTEGANFTFIFLYLLICVLFIGNLKHVRITLLLQLLLLAISGLQFPQLFPSVLAVLLSLWLTKYEIILKVKALAGVLSRTTSTIELKELRKLMKFAPIVLKALFFNMLDNSFLSFLVWIVLFSLLKPEALKIHASQIGIIGIGIAVFQFYLPFFRAQVGESLRKFIHFGNELSPYNFLKFLKEKYPKIHEKVTEHLGRTLKEEMGINLETFYKQLVEITQRFRFLRGTNILFPVFFPSEKSIMHALDQLIEKEENLIKYYKEFFENAKTKVVEELEQYKDVIFSLAVSSIPLFWDLLLEVPLLLPAKKKVEVELKSYEEWVEYTTFEILRNIVHL